VDKKTTPGEPERRRDPTRSAATGETEVENRETWVLARETAAEARESAADSREFELTSREQLALLRDEALRARTEADEVRADRERVVIEMREANEKLVLATVWADELAEKANESEARYRTLTENLKLADLRKDEFLALLAHELRNPMAAISMALSMLELVEGDAAKTTKHRETAQRQMGSLVRLVDDLLDVSRITSGKVELRKEEVDLASIVQNALTATRPAIEARGHALTLAVAPGFFRMDADATRLEQVLVNLLVNAAKYTDPGGTVSVRLGREIVKGGAQAVLAVRDTGHGIPKDMLDHVFDLFVQLSPTIHHGAGGLGLGLTLVRRLVEMHGGTVAATSEGVGKGSEFVVRLPLSKGNQEEIPLLARTDQTSVARRRRIVLVEDSDDLRNTLKELLETLGHEVTVAVSGPEGVSRLLDMRPDVGLVDVGLPGIDGYEVARRVRAEPGGDKVYLVALTGYGGPDTTAKAEGAGFDLHLTKPVDIKQLQQVVQQARDLVATVQTNQHRPPSDS
jgi:signal transduction histidine kinase/ActR/RegA family two-component response regulator